MERFRTRHPHTISAKYQPKDYFGKSAMKPEPEGLNKQGTVVAMRNIRNERIRKAYAEGEVPKWIGGREKLSPQQVRLICKGVMWDSEKRVEKKRGRREERDERIRIAHGQNQTDSKIAKREGLTPQKVKRIWKMMERNEKIRERYAAGEALKSIGDDYDLTTQAISIICKEVELKPKIDD
jgi:hypothetical protein